VTVQTAVCHVKSRVGAGAKKIFASAAPQNQKVAQKNKEKRVKRALLFCFSFIEKRGKLQVSLSFVSLSQRENYFISAVSFSVSLFSKREKCLVFSFLFLFLQKRNNFQLFFIKE
jgi:hypothetical protein